MNRSHFTYILLCSLSIKITAQDVEQEYKSIKNALKEKPVSISGGISASALSYQAKGIGPQRDPFYWVMNANVQVQLFQKITIPFSAVFTQKDQGYSNGLERYSRPFNQFGLSPRYRWLTLHVGYRSLEFSEYSLSGALFVGGGFEIKPEKSFFQVTIIYGRFAKAIAPGTLSGLALQIPSYERWGGAAKLRMGSDNNHLVLTVMKLADRINSIPFDSSNVQAPQENEVISLGTQQKINKRFSAAAEIAISLLSNNLYESTRKLPGYNYINQIFQTRPSSIFSKAGNARLNYQGAHFQGAITYKRIDPSYRSLGTIFLTNDIEETALQFSTQFLKKKLSLNIAGGLQRNNLDRSQLNNTNRIISSFNLSANPRKNLNLQANYSSFSSNSVPVRDVFNDTIRFLQLTETAGFNGTYSFEKGKLKSTIVSQLNYQQSSGNVSPKTNFYSAMLALQQNFGKIGTALSLSALYNRMESTAIGASESIGPNLSLQQPLLKSRLRLSISTTLLYQYLKRKLLSQNQSLSFGTSYEVQSGTTLKLDYNLLKRSASASSVSSFQEQRVNLTVQTNLKPKKKQKNK